jgi:hypothetical protein
VFCGAASGEREAQHDAREHGACERRAAPTHGKLTDCDATFAGC